MPRDYKVYVEDILESIEKVQEYTRGLTLPEFVQDRLVFDATLRNLAIIGEAARSIPELIKKKHPEIEWRKIVEFRNIVIHEYFEMDHEIIWDVIQNKLPTLKLQIEKIHAS